MADLDLVEVLDACEDLMEESTCLSVLKAPLLDNVIKEFAARRVFHYQEKLFVRLNDFIELNNVRVSHYLQDMNLSHDSCDVRLVLDHVLLEDLDRHFLMRQLMDALTNFSKCSLPDGLAYHIVPNKPAVRSFLTALGCLPVTLFSLLILELGQCLFQRSLHPLSLSHLHWFCSTICRASRSLWTSTHTCYCLAPLCFSNDSPSLNFICH